jgi:hypothetical protein
VAASNAATIPSISVSPSAFGTGLPWPAAGLAHFQASPPFHGTSQLTFRAAWASWMPAI